MIALFALAALQAASAIKQADEIRSSADLTRSLNEVNAKYAEMDANEAEVFGDTQAARYQSTIDSTLGAQKTAYASQNVDIGFGTAADVQKETSLTGALNIIDIKNQAHMKALGLRKEARNIRQSSSMSRSQSEINANATLTSGILNASATGYRASTQLPSGDNGTKPSVLGTANRTGG